jgi:hypothetical protein
VTSDSDATGWQHGGVSTADPHTVFQNSRLIILFALVLALCATPVAFAAPFLWLVYLVPIAVVVWVVRVRTVVDTEAVTVRKVVGRRRVPWDRISALKLGDRSGVTAVLSDGAELPLPAIRVRDLPQLAAASGGRLPDPAGD